MNRLYVLLAARLLALLMVLVCGLSGTARMLGGGTVIQYGLAAPDDRVIYLGVDVGHNLRVARADPLPAQLFSATDTASDGRKVEAAPTSGHVDLFLVETDGTRRQLTHFPDFMVTGDERVDRRANLYPSWSPDAVWVAFISSTPSGRLDLYLVQPDGSGLTHVSNRIRVAEPYTPRWVTFETHIPVEWLLAAAMGLLGVWLMRGYKRP